MRRSEIRYARAGDHHIAFREFVGDDRGDQEIVMVNGWNMPMEALPEDPIAHRLLEGLAALGRLIVLDLRGIALSDPVSDWETPLREQWADDLAAVIKEAGCDTPAVFSYGPSPIARTCTVRYPELIGRLVLFNPSAPPTADDAEWRTKAIERVVRIQDASDEADGGLVWPNRWHDPAFRAWFDAAGRAGASPRQAQRLSEKMFLDPPFDNAQIATPTLVITRYPPETLQPEEYIGRAARQISGAQHVALPPGDGFPFGEGVEDIIAEISRFLTGDVRLPAPERQLCAILFTDLVDSTRRAEAAGDAAWKRLLDRHDAVNRTTVTRKGGNVIKTTGDGVLALLPSATAAIDAAQTIRAELRNEDLEVRIGIHLGEIDRRGDDVSGLAVNVAARIMAAATSGQILVSEMVTQLVTTAAFEDAGTRTLKGVEGTWQLFEVA